jgi:hypothetical protein
MHLLLKEGARPLHMAAQEGRVAVVVPWSPDTRTVRTAAWWWWWSPQLSALARLASLPISLAPDTTAPSPEAPEKNPGQMATLRLCEPPVIG